MMKLYKIIFLNSLIFGTLISISSYSWMSMWMGLEINLLSIIPLFNSTKNLFSSESSLKYFISQTLASLILLFSMIMMMSSMEFISTSMNLSFKIIMNSALLMKLGAAPFHFWFPEVMEGLNWMNSLLLLTWQKIAPMILLMNNNMNWKFINFIMIMSLMISGIMMFNQTSLRKILTFSSINHIAWMLASMMISFEIWLIYFIVYSINSINLILMFKYTNSFFIQQLINSLNNHKLLKFFVMFNLFSLAGLPPLLGFFPKWLIINWMIYNNMMLMSSLLIILTLMTTYIYIKLMFSSLILTHNETLNNMKYENYYIIMLNWISISSLLFFVMFSYF